MKSNRLVKILQKFYRNETVRKVNLTIKYRVVSMSYPGNRSYS